MSSLKAATAKLSAPSPTPSFSSNSGSKRKRPEDGPVTTVFSQPQETGTGSHILTQFTYTIDHLRGHQRWVKLQDILDYLNVPVNSSVAKQLVQLYHSQNPTNRIEYNRKTDMYRYKPKYDVRNAAQLKGYLQNQQSAAGLSVKELKDGWANASEAIVELEKKKEVLVTHHKKDNVVKTVWLNDPSLMHPMDDEFRTAWHTIQLPADSEDLRNKLLSAGLKPCSAPKRPMDSKPKEKKRKAPRRGGKQTNTHMAAILKDFSHLRK
jgi:transcription initiation factor TFIIE subunit beta